MDHHSTTDAGAVAARTAAKVVVLSGVPGAGKDYFVKRLPHGRSRLVVVSADDYFTGADGVYRFDVAGLGRAHGECLRRFAEALRAGDGCTIVVNNTNTTALEMDRYVCLASAYGVPCEIVRILCNPVVAAARNVHGVPPRAVLMMAARADKTFNGGLPPRWNVKVSEVPESTMSTLGDEIVPGAECKRCRGHGVIDIAANETDECPHCEGVGVYCDGCPSCRDGCLCACPEEHAEALAAAPMPRLF